MLLFRRLPALACLLASSVYAQAAESADQNKATTEMYGGALSIQYGIDTCDIPTTLQQRADVKRKLAEFKQQAGITGELSQAEIKDLVGLKTDEDVKAYCTGLSLLLPGMIADMIAEKPPAQWGKPAAVAEAAPAQPATPSPAPAHATVGDWEVGLFDDKTPGDCMMVRDYHDKDDGDAENAVVLRSGPGLLRLAVHYAKWNWTSGQTVAAPLVSADDVIDGNAKWTADKTGKTLSTELKPDRLVEIRKAKQLTLKFDDGDADFDVPLIDAAAAALTTCTHPK